jgi:hypothetical protein
LADKLLSYKISLFGCVFAAVVVLLGAYTRLVDASLLLLTMVTLVYTLGQQQSSP